MKKKLISLVLCLLMLAPLCAAGAEDSRRLHGQRHGGRGEHRSTDRSLCGRAAAL